MPNKVTYAESNTLKTREVARFVREQGLVAGRDNGHPWRDENGPRDDNSVGIYLPNTRPHEKFPLIGLVRCHEWGQIGTIYTSDRDRGAHNKNWVMEVFGRENVDRLKEFAEILVQEFKVDVHVRLERNQTRWCCPAEHS